MSKTKLSKRTWISILIFGLFGQVAWIVENMYFNVFLEKGILYEQGVSISQDIIANRAFYISTMVAASAIIATLATLIGGTFSDKIGKRKKIVSWGYIIWGITIMVFAGISVHATMSVFPSLSADKAAMITIAFIIFMDCVMSFFGSSSNDAAFTSWVTDVTDSTNRSTVESVISLMPLIAMAVVFGGFDWLTADTYQYLDGTTGTAFKEGAMKIASGNWPMFFIILGVITTAVGALSLWLMKDSPNLKPSPVASYKNMLYGFKPSVVKRNKNLYIVYGAMAVSGIANNTFIPYLIMYFSNTLGYENYIIPVGLIIALSAVASVALGMLADKTADRRKFFLPGVAGYVIGAVSLYFISPVCFPEYGSTPIWLVGIGGFVLMTGNLLLSSLLAATARDLTPVKLVGQFQGIRMFFFVLIPMCFGPFITAFATRNSQTVMTDYYGNPIYSYPPTIFLLAAGIALLVTVPVIFLMRSKKEDLYHAAE